MSVHKTRVILEVHIKSKCRLLGCVDLSKEVKTRGSQEQAILTRWVHRGQVTRKVSIIGHKRLESIKSKLVSRESKEYRLRWKSKITLTKVVNKKLATLKLYIKSK